MKHGMKVPFAVWVIALAMFAGSSSAATYYVRSSGNDQADGRSPQTAFRSLIRAAQVFDNGDSVLIGPGTYKETVLFAEQFGTPEVRVRISGDESGKLTGDTAGPVVIQPSTPSQAAITLQRFQYLTISGLTFRGPGPGLKLGTSREAVVERCTFDGLSTGLSVEGCRNVRAESLVFARCSVSANIRGSTATRLAHLTIAGSSTVGIMAVNSAVGEVRNCLFVANNSNLVADKASACSWKSDYNVLQGTSGPWGQVPIIAYPAEWFSASGQDRHSIHVAPAFVAPERFDLHVASEVSWGGGLPGMFVGTSMEPAVKTDRDGKPFRNYKGAVCVGAYDYPDPEPANGWKPLDVTLQGKGPRQSAGVYKPEGTLVRMLVTDVAGVRKLWWDGRDDEGQPAEAAKYEIRSAVHDVRMLEDGQVGDNGSALGTFNCDNASRALVLPDGRFVVATYYDEASLPLRFYSSSGRSLFGRNLADTQFQAMTLDGDSIIAGVNGSPASRLERILLDGERTLMADNAEFYPVYDAQEQKVITDEQARVGKYSQEKGKFDQELKRWEFEADRAAKAGRPFPQPKPTPPADPNPPLKLHELMGVAVTNHVAYVALGGLDVIRAMDLATGRKKSDWPMPQVGDIATDAQDTLWVISGREVVALQPDGKVARRYATGLATPRFLAAGPGRLAVGDAKAERIALLDVANGNIIRTLGKDVDPKAWNLRDPGWFPALRGIAFFPDGRLLVCMHLAVRAIWPETGKPAFEQYSNFLDICVAHPQKPEYVYSQQGIVRVDQKTGAVEWLAGLSSLAGGMCPVAAVLGGRPFIGFRAEGGIVRLFDVTDPIRPRLALNLEEMNRDESFQKLRFGICTFGRDCAAVCPAPPCSIVTWAFKGLDRNNNPVWDYANPVTFGPKEDPSSRKMTIKRDITADPKTGDAYYLAVTPRHNKMVPAWGADGTGVGKTAADGKAPWFSLSSGGNYQCLTSVNDGKNYWIMACKSFGGQLDVFDPDGLRLTTGNWGWLSNYQSGFVDTINGVSSYLRPDGKPGVYVEDDMIGRFLRARLDGGETIEKDTTSFRWSDVVAAGAPASADSTGRDLARGRTIPRVPELRMDGDWSAWEKAGVAPQIISLPFVNWGYIWPSDLFDTYKAGTSVGAIAHDGKNLYAYFLTTDDTPHFETDNSGIMFCFDSIELWIEEEQFGLGFVRSGKPALFKYRYHNRQGAEWAANYPMPDASIWGAKLADVTTHPLGKLLESATGASLAGRSGYALMARIPFEEIKLVGGLAGVPERRGTVILPATGKPGEVLRIAIAFDGLLSWGRSQDFKVYWPSSLMFSDPTRSMPFVFGQ